VAGTCDVSVNWAPDVSQGVQPKKPKGEKKTFRKQWPLPN
jgi:hypothetical protein